MSWELVDFRPEAPCHKHPHGRHTNSECKAQQGTRPNQSNCREGSPPQSHFDQRPRRGEDQQSESRRKGQEFLNKLQQGWEGDSHRPTRFGQDLPDFEEPRDHGKWDVQPAASQTFSVRGRGESPQALLRCTVCRIMGHTDDTCPNPNKPRRQGRIICDYCGKPNHVEEQCWNKRKDEAALGRSPRTRILRPAEADFVESMAPNRQPPRGPRASRYQSESPRGSHRSSCSESPPPPQEQPPWQTQQTHYKPPPFPTNPTFNTPPPPSNHLNPSLSPLPSPLLSPENPTFNPTFNLEAHLAALTHSYCAICLCPTPIGPIFRSQDPTSQSQLPANPIDDPSYNHTHPHKTPLCTAYLTHAIPAHHETAFWLQASPLFTGLIPYCECCDVEGYVRDRAGDVLVSRGAEGWKSEGWAVKMGGLSAVVPCECVGLERCEGKVWADMEVVRGFRARLLGEEEEEEERLRLREEELQRLREEALRSRQEPPRKEGEPGPEPEPVSGRPGSESPPDMSRYRRRY